MQRTNKSTPLISICIPAFNRPVQLEELLTSIRGQEFSGLEIVIAEDASPERKAIRAVVEKYRASSIAQINYVENADNLGYDGNLRQLVALARGEYCLFMGNDDLLCSGALEQVRRAIDDYEDIGVILRSYRSFVGTPDNIQQEFKYFPDVRYFPPGKDTIITFFRRSVVISGLVVHRQTALELATSHYDGLLLYQVYLISNILASRPGLYLPTPLVLVRMDGRPDFGSSRVEAGKHTPGCRTPQSSLNFVKGMLVIAKDLDDSNRPEMYQAMLHDLANYSYPLLRVQRDFSIIRFFAYVYGLMQIGLWRSPLFFIYFITLVLLGGSVSDRLIGFIKRIFGATPRLGSFYGGERK